MADINVFGHKVSPVAATAIGAGSIVVIWFAWKQHKAGAGTGTSASAIDPLTGLPVSQDNQPDPLTGETYLTEAQQYGSVQAAEQALSGSGASFTQGSPFGTGNGGGGTSLVPANTVQGTTYASNAAWAQAVEAGLTDIGYAPTDIAAALGRYLSNLSETPEQASITRAAIAEYGLPPVGSFVIVAAPAAPEPAKVTGTPAVTAAANSTYATLSWAALHGATSYHLQVDTLVAGKPGTTVQDTSVTGTSTRIPVRPGASYQVRVAGQPGGPWSAWHTFKAPAK